MTPLGALLFAASLWLAVGTAAASQADPTLSFTGCWPEGSSIQSSAPCPCFYNASQGSCFRSLAKYYQEPPECASLFGSSYFLQHRQKENDIEFTMNMNMSLQLTVMLVQGNCSLDCSGARKNPCDISLQVAEVTMETKAVHFNISQQNLTNYCLRIRLKNRVPCVLYTRQYSLDFLPPYATLDIKNTQVVISILITGFLTSVVFISLLLFALHHKCVPRFCFTTSLYEI